MHHLNRYENFITRCRARPLPAGKYEDHHVIPKVLGGQDIPSNMVRLTPREHFLAHWMLASAYPDVTGLAYAFVCMYSTGQPTKLDLKSSRIYERGRAALRERISAANRKLVTVLDTKTGQLRRVPRQEYLDDSTLVGAMKGKTIAKRVSTGERVVCTREELQNDPDLVHPNTGLTGERNGRFSGWFVTPLGRYASADLAAQAHGLNSDMSIVNRCKKHCDNVLTSRSFNSVTDLSSQEKSRHVGKTWRDMGWYFEPA